MKDDGTWDTIASGPSQADQAALEAETNEDTYAPPDLLHFAPSAAKVVVKWEQTGAHSIKVSYNMTSVTDGGGAGDTDHLWATDFSSADWSGGTLPETGSHIGIVVASLSAGGVTTLTRNEADTSVDNNNNSMVLFGDQS